MTTIVALVGAILAGFMSGYVVCDVSAARERWRRARRERIVWDVVSNWNGVSPEMLEAVADAVEEAERTEGRS